jgi:hypothetical protein
MVASTTIIKALTALVGIAFSVVQASPTGIDRRNDLVSRQDKNPRSYGFQQSEVFYHDREFITKIADWQKYADDKPLSMARFENADAQKYFWYIDQNPVFQAAAKEGLPGNGCIVGLYFDDIRKRAKRAGELKYEHNKDAKDLKDRWAVPAISSPWCNTDIPLSDNNYEEKGLGFIWTKASYDFAHPAAFVTLGCVTKPNV